MKTVTLRNIEIGRGIPKVFVPIVGKGRGDIIAMAKRLSSMELDAVEWRADFYEDIHDLQGVLDTLGELRAALGDMPLIFTCRTLPEGGCADMAEGEYAALNRAVNQSRLADGIDVEAFSHGECAAALIRDIKACGLVAVGSCHIKEGTPSRAEMADMLLKIRDMGADIPKIVVNARCTKDTLELLAATEEIRLGGHGPVITAAMGEQGLVSRIVGEIFGSAATFASVGKGSAPGQIPLDTMNTLLKTIHRQL